MKIRTIPISMTLNPQAVKRLLDASGHLSRALQEGTICDLRIEYHPQMDEKQFGAITHAHALALALLTIHQLCLDNKVIGPRDVEKLAVTAHAVGVRNTEDALKLSEMFVTVFKQGMVGFIAKKQNMHGWCIPDQEKTMFMAFKMMMERQASGMDDSKNDLGYEHSLN